jgi:hypothetical protein
MSFENKALPLQRNSRGTLACHTTKRKTLSNIFGHEYVFALHIDSAALTAVLCFERKECSIIAHRLRQQPMHAEC